MGWGSGSTAAKGGRARGMTLTMMPAKGGSGGGGEGGGEEEGVEEEDARMDSTTDGYLASLGRMGDFLGGAAVGGDDDAGTVGDIAKVTCPQEPEKHETSEIPSLPWEAGSLPHGSDSVF